MLDDLDKGLIDFGLVFGIFDKSKYDYIELPCKDTYGILMRKDSELAEKDVIVPEDLWDKPLICSRNSKIMKIIFSSGCKRSYSAEHHRNLQPSIQRFCHGGKRYRLFLCFRQHHSYIG